MTDFYDYDDLELDLDYDPDDVPAAGTPDDFYDEPDELPEDEWCVMCGQEWGTSLRSDGGHYCSMCWQVWNS